MYGAILGDIIGSPFEFDRGDKTKNFDLFSEGCGFTDDSVMTIAVGEALLAVGPEAAVKKIEDAVASNMQDWGKRYPHAGYGGSFRHWLKENNPKPYGSYGNGSAMRVSAVGWLYDSMERTREVARATANVTHNHPEGIKGAESTASAIYMARNGSSKEEIKTYIEREFHYDLSRTLDNIRTYYHHVESCQETVPEAIIAFLESKDFEDAIRNAVSLGGDTDTLGAITGSIAEAFYGIPAVLIAECKSRIDKGLMTDVLDEFDHVLGSRSVDTYPSNVSGNAKIYLNVGIVIFCLLWYILSIMFDVWYIHLEPTQIIYRNYLGAKKVIKASDIYYFERNSNGSLIIVCSDETKVSFEPEYADSIMLWMSEQSIKTKNARKKDRFIIRPAKYQRVLSVLCLVVFFAFLLLGIFTYNVVVSLVFGLLLIFGIWNCGYHYSKKYTIGNGYIEESSILKRKKLIAYVDISEAEIKQGDNVTYILLFDKRSKRPIIKINMYYENAFLIKELAYKMNWLK